MSPQLVAFHHAQKGNHLHESRKSVRNDSFWKGSSIMEISLRLVLLGFVALALTGALAQSPESPTV